MTAAMPDVNVLDADDLKKGRQVTAFARRLLDRTATTPLRLVAWECEKGNLSRSMEKVGPPLLRRWPRILRVEPGKAGVAVVTIESVGGGTLGLFLCPEDIITVEVA